MTIVRNISNGPRGAYLDGVLVTVDPGKTTEADDFAKEWFVPAGEEPEGYAAVTDLTLAELVAVAIDEGVIDDAEMFRSQLAIAIQEKRLAAIMSVPADDDDTFDHDGDGKAGGSTPQDPPALAGKNKAELLDIAAAEGAEADESMKNDDIKAAIEAKRGE